jgi:drug/metabolite transporter (DMT)-like permease
VSHPINRHFKGHEMLDKLGPILLIVVSSVAYQFAQRAVSSSANAFSVFVLVYLLGTLFCVVLASLWGRPVAVTDLQLLKTWPTWILGAAVVGIEVGYLWAYRTGWPVGTAVGVTYTLTIGVLAVAGVLFLSEEISLRRVAGLAFSLAGLWLLLAPSSKG